MRTSRIARRKSPGLGLLIKPQGLAMVQTAPTHDCQTDPPLWHWQALGHLADEVMPDGSWPDPKWVKQARLQSFTPCTYKWTAVFRSAKCGRR